jgi:hypothetical protein
VFCSITGFEGDAVEARIISPGLFVYRHQTYKM